MRALSAVLMMWFSVCASATERWHAGTVNKIYPLGEGSVVITFDLSDSYCVNASSPKYYLIRIGQNGVTSDGLKNMLATAMLAKATGRTLSIAFSDATADCLINRLFVE
jgi:hypothetical protein